MAVERYLANRHAARAYRVGVRHVAGWGPYERQVKALGAVHHHALDEASGSALDRIGSRTLALSGTVTREAAPLVEGARSTSFNGTTGYFGTAAAQFTPTTGAMSVTAALVVPADGSMRPIWKNGTGDGVGLFISDLGALSVIKFGAYLWASTGDVSAYAGRPLFVAFTFDGTATECIYAGLLDTGEWLGLLDSKTDGGAPLAPSGGCAIGRNAQGSEAGYWSGRMGPVSTWSRALAAAEARGLFTMAYGAYRR
ncbi:MAG: hypothetical protein WC211_01205 [Dehalococcoidia bacterium]